MYKSILLFVLLFSNVIVSAQVWEIPFDFGATNLRPKALKATPDGGVALVLHATGGQYSGKIILLKIDGNANVEWFNVINASSSADIFQLLVRFDNSIILRGFFADHFYSGLQVYSPQGDSLRSFNTSSGSRYVMLTNGNIGALSELNNYWQYDLDGNIVAASNGPFGSQWDSKGIVPLDNGAVKVSSRGGLDHLPEHL
ncbi:MAG: hypothetical protein AAFV80_07420 [Bacteroidota bacterium]